MERNQSLKADVQWKKTAFFQIGFVAAFLFICMAFEPVKAQENTETTVPDTVVQEKKGLKIIDEMPVFIGGEDARQKFLLGNLVYPETAKEQKLQGRVFVGFTVEKDGSVTNVNLLKSCGHPILDEEALRVAKLMPNWEPAHQKGQIIRVSYGMPVMFTLEEKKSEVLNENKSDTLEEKKSDTLEEDESDTFEEDESDTFEDDED